MFFKTQASAKFDEIKLKRDNKTIKKLSDALELAAHGMSKWKANSKRCIYTYADGSSLTIRLDGYCYLNNGWMNDNGKAYFISEDDIDEPCINIGFKNETNY